MFTIKEMGLRLAQVNKMNEVTEENISLAQARQIIRDSSIGRLQGASMIPVRLEMKVLNYYEKRTKKQQAKK